MVDSKFALDASRVLTLLLPVPGRMAAAAAPFSHRMLARGDTVHAAAGETAQLQRNFDILPRGLPVAALTRELDVGDARHGGWLRADPAHVRADLGAGRLMGCGDVGLTPTESEKLIAALRPMFGDEGFPISAGSATRWYLMLPRETRLPAFATPGEVLGDDIFPHLPEGDAGRRWRRLMSEAQIILHQHPVNAARIARGEAPINSLWIWGGGSWPDHVRSPHLVVATDDALLHALARAAACEHVALAQARFDRIQVRGALIDLRGLRDLAVLERDWIVPALHMLAAGACDGVVLDVQDGRRCSYRARHRWRFWRRASSGLLS